MRSFTLMLMLAADDAFDQQEENHAAVENREGQQVEDAEVEADHAGQLELVGPALGLRRIAGHAGDAHRTGRAARRRPCA